jgi:hypothetical protein
MTPSSPSSPLDDGDSCGARDAADPSAVMQEAFKADAQRALAQMAEGAAGDADNEVAANAMQVSPAIMPAATSVISTGPAARDFGGVLLVCWVWAVNSFWLIGFLPVTFPSRRRLAMFLSSLVAGPTASVPDRDAGVCNLADTAAGYLRIPPCVRPASTPALRPSRSGGQWAVQRVTIIDVLPRRPDPAPGNWRTESHECHEFDELARVANRPEGESPPEFGNGRTGSPFQAQPFDEQLCSDTFQCPHPVVDRPPGVLVVALSAGRNRPYSGGSRQRGPLQVARSSAAARRRRCRRRCQRCPSTAGAGPPPATTIRPVPPGDHRAGRATATGRSARPPAYPRWRSAGAV